MEPISDLLAQEREEGQLLALAASRLKVIGCREVRKDSRLKREGRARTQERLHAADCLKEERVREKLIGRKRKEKPW